MSFRTVKQSGIFLLSTDEARKYFTDDNSRLCAPTGYAALRSTWTNSSFAVDNRATCWWWLRTPSTDINRAAGISYNGSIDVTGADVTTSNKGTRPAIWISLE